MAFGRRKFLTLGAAALAAPAMPCVVRAQQPVIVLKLHHFLSPVAYAHTRFLTPWARSVEKDLNGRIRIDLFPSMQLGGTAPQLYDQVVSGTADIRVHLARHAAGFRASRYSSFPSSPTAAPTANTRAVQQLYETRLRDEFREVQPICVWAHDQGVLHTVKPVNKLEDLKGLEDRARDKAVERGAEGAGLWHNHAGAADTGRTGAEGDRWLPRAVGGGARDQAAGAGEVSYRNRRIADALHRDLHSGDEQGALRRASARPEQVFDKHSGKGRRPTGRGRGRSRPRRGGNGPQAG